jgi:hypothetical protein
LKIALISCTKRKQTEECAASEMYLVSTLFSKAIKYINQKNYDDWFILSAQHGLLDKNKIIKPYNLTLKTMKNWEIKEWSRDVFHSLIQMEITKIDFYAGESYRKHLIPLLEKHGVKYNVPLKGMGIGQQLQFYTRELKG